MILIKNNVERVVNDASQGIIDQLLLDGWSKVSSETDPKPKRKVKGEVKKGGKTI